MAEGSVLIVEDNPDILLSAKLLLKKEFQQLFAVADPEAGAGLLEKEQIDVVILDMNFTKGETSGKEGLFWLKRFKEIQNDATVIMLTAFGDVDLAVQAVRAGAADFILKPWQNEKLLATAINGRNNAQKARRVSLLEHSQRTREKQEAEETGEIVGTSSGMKQVLELARKVAGTTANILLLGENGTGKEVIARFIHRLSDRKEKTFVKVDVGAIPDGLFESELFGVKKGAFTDAREDKPGRIELAEGGTLFLDEIGNLSTGSQSKLLSVIQNRQVQRLGSTQVKNMDVRLISATNMPLLKMSKDGTFRQDLLYRINTVEIQIPPLRERIADILPLAKHFIRHFAPRYGKGILKISPSTEKALLSYSWPGNVRELQHAIERSVILSESDWLEEKLLIPGEITVPKNDAPETLVLGEVEKRTIMAALKKHKGNISQAAKELGLTRTALYRRMEKYGI